MKKFLLLAALACGSLSAMADVTITFHGSVQDGEGNFDVMFNDTEVDGEGMSNRRDVQLEITLPEGLTIVNQGTNRKPVYFVGDDDETTGALVGHAVGSNFVDGSYRLVINSTDGSHLYNGRLCSFKVTLDSKFAQADFIVKNITVSSEDGESVKPADIAANAVPVKVTSTGVGTIVSPYEIVLPNGVKAAEGSDDGKTVTVDESKASSILNAGVPSFLIGSEVDATFYGVASVAAPSKGAVLTGTFVKQEISSGYVLQGGKLRNVNTTVTLPAYKAYIAADGSGVKEFSLNGFTTGITVNEAINGEQVIYNVAGQRLNKTQKGVNIVNGKKYIVK